MTEVSRSLRNSKDHLQRKNDLGQTAAHMAVLRPEILSLLLRKGSDFDAVDNQGNSPLIYAASYEQIESLMILLKGGANPVQDGRIRVLDNAMSRGQWSMVGKLLESFRINTCLSRELLQREIDNFMLANWPEWGPIKKSYKKFLDQMISIGANKHAVDKDGNTLLHLSNNRDAVAALFGQGFDLIDHPNNKGRTALMQSILINSRENYTADVILTRGCDLDHQDEDGKTALHLAYMRLSDLTQPQIDVDNDFWATRRNYPPSMILILIARLLSQGANMFISDRCRCPCCPDGCPPFLQLPCVQRLMGDYPSSNDAMGYIWILETLLTLLESGLVDSARKMLLALKRAREFDLAGMTHVCCRRKVISELGPLDDEDIDEILDEEREDILTLDKKMGGVEATQGTKSLEESWLNVLLKLPSGNEKTKQPGEWAYYDTVYSIWISDGGKTLRNRPHPCLPVDEERFLLVDEEVDQYVRFRKGWSYLPRSQMYLAWVEWFYNNRTEFEYPSPIDENWYTKRKYWATRQAEVLERAKSSNELLNDNKAP
ncbi:hypothetical protein N7456_002248 [Penicillium angulare]|uniref:Ankyrin n=1 Tax=Penicillium angulare TaxID=116970 RepID=A0A9W9KNU2_9EURO|nr:hypothetical protein N7456_002248 [Penicillium angulare]